MYHPKYIGVETRDTAPALLGGFGRDEEKTKERMKMSNQYFTVVAKGDLQYPEYPVLNWRKGGRYIAKDNGNGTLRVESETGPFFFTGKARERLTEVFDFEQGCRNLLKGMGGYTDEQIESMTDADCEAEWEELRLGGHGESA